MKNEPQHDHVPVQTENQFIYIQAYGDWCNMDMLRFVPHQQPTLTLCKVTFLSHGIFQFTVIGIVNAVLKHKQAHQGVKKSGNNR